MTGEKTFYDFVNPHCRILSTDGCFYGNGPSACTAQAGMFRPALARLIVFEAGNPIFGSLNDSLLMPRTIRSGPGVAPSFERKDLEAIFHHKVFKMLLSRGKITQDLVSMLLSWWH